MAAALVACHLVCATAAAQPAEHARLAPQALLIALARAGPRLVAAGERGIIVYSDDAGAGWRQAATVPTQALLTGLCFFDARHGVAVGHDQTILVSADAGLNWQAVHEVRDAPGPLLDVWCGPAGQALAVGAYSTFLRSRDAGRHWSAEKFAAQPLKPGDARTDYHLNRIVAAPAARLFIAAEAGHLYRSDDAGQSWQELPSPYPGSFFGLLPLEAQALLAFGLRGNLFRSGDGGLHWQRIQTATHALLDAGARAADGALLVGGLSGTLLRSVDDGRSFTLTQRPEWGGLSALLPAGPGMVAVGERGAQRLQVFR